MPILFLDLMIAFQIYFYSHKKKKKKNLNILFSAFDLTHGIASAICYSAILLYLFILVKSMVAISLLALINSKHCSVFKMECI